MAILTLTLRYRHLKSEKRHLPNHRLYDPTKKMSDKITIIPYFCYLSHLGMRLTLLVSTALKSKAFNEFLALDPDMKYHHEKLLKMLEAHNKVIEINKDCETFEEVKNGNNEPTDFRRS